MAKHGVDFSTVLRIFEDPDRLIVPNLKHSPDEPRFYAIGQDGYGILMARALDRGQQKAAGIPEPAAVGKMKVARKPARPARINIRTTHETIAGLRAQAEEAGMPYQTLAQRASHGRQRGVKIVLGPRRLIAEEVGVLQQDGGR